MWGIVVLIGGEGIQWMDRNGMLLFDVESLFISGHRDGYVKDSPAAC